MIRAPRPTTDWPSAQGGVQSALYCGRAKRRLNIGGGLRAAMGRYSLVDGGG